VKVRYQLGFGDDLRSEAARLYDEAFGTKLGVGIPSVEDRLRVIAEGLQPEYGIVAFVEDELAGLAGFHDRSGSLTGGIDFGVLRRNLGLLGALRAVAVLGWLERKPAVGELLMDGIVVAPEARGQGIGSGLFAELEKLATERGFTSIRLDVVDTNPAARRLYERLGFAATKTERLPILGKRMGFSSSTVMVKRL